MSPHRYSLLWATVAALAIGIFTAACLAWHARRQSNTPLTVSYWYWQIPFHLRPNEIAELKEMGVHRLFVRAATFEPDGVGGIRLSLPQSFKSNASDLQVSLVFNFHYGLVRQFERMPNSQLVLAVLRGVQREKEAARSARVSVKGIQLDLDCPTRLLPKYAQFLAELAPAIHRQKMELSVTALPTWYTSRVVQSVAAAVDFMAPQFYEAQIPKTRDRLVTIANLRLMRRGMQAADRIGRPFYVGIPAYGHALVYGYTGKLIGLYHDMGVGEALRCPSFHFVRAYTAARGESEEEMVELVTDEAAQPDPSAALSANEGLPEVGPYHIVYDLPTPEVIAQYIAELRRAHLTNCRGVILFRFPEPGDEETVPLSSVAAVLHGERPRPVLTAKTSISSVPWQAIEAVDRQSIAGVDRSLELRLTNIGTGVGFAGPGALTVTLHFDRPGVEETGMGMFDSVAGFCQAGSSDSGQALPASIGRANLLIYHGQSL
ncbi:MAG TPA: DUF3142 domain-containing protein, partial [Capsulimonadaceae bacterium]|nr:DUF3142 domain-containing protein [Capsulimonadaceae bacterium]